MFALVSVKVDVEDGLSYASVTPVPPNVSTLLCPIYGVGMIQCSFLETSLKTTNHIEMMGCCDITH